MAATQRDLQVGQPIGQVWNFVSDMGNWATQMPGYVSHEAINADDSAWTLNVDLGPFQRSVIVDVRVVRWAEPSAVDFEIKGRYEPFSGSGTYRAEPTGEGVRIHLAFEAEPSGSMAKMITPFVGPVLERTADQFSHNLGNALGGAIVVTDREVPSEAHPGLLRRIAQRLAAFIRTITAQRRK